MSTYVKLSTGWWSDDEITCSFAARGLFAGMLSYAGDRLTDGRISARALAMITAGVNGATVDDWIRELEACALVTRDGIERWQIVGYADWQTTREQVHAKRDAAAERARKSRENRRNKPAGHGVTDAHVTRESQRTCADVTEPETETETETEVSTYVDTRVGPLDDDTGHWPEARRLCAHLAESVAESTGTKPKTSTEAWVRDMERLIRLDGIAPERIERIINWIFTDPAGGFWIPNVQSPSKLRAKFAQLVAQANRQQQSSGHNPAHDAQQAKHQMINDVLNRNNGAGALELGAGAA